MAAFQFEIGQCVIEGLRIELDDIGFSAIVVGMTVLAFGKSHIRPLAVETGLVRQIFRDVLMAIETEPSLALFGEGLVTTLTSFFKFGVPLDDLAGHHQFFK